MFLNSTGFKILGCFIFTTQFFNFKLNDICYELIRNKKSLINVNLLKIKRKKEYLTEEMPVFDVEIIWKTDDEQISVDIFSVYRHYHHFAVSGGSIEF